MLEHRRAQSFNFMSYLVKALDDDVCEVVKISMAGWITLVVVQTLWAPVMYAGWALLGGTILFVCSVLLICTKLIVVVRHVTREGRINKLEPSVFWFSQPRLLLPVVRFTLFVNSAIFAIMVRCIYLLSVLNGDVCLGIIGHSIRCAILHFQRKQRPRRLGDLKLDLNLVSEHWIVFPHQFRHVANL